MSLIIQENVPLAAMTTLKIGGRARYFARINHEAEIVEALDFASRNNLETFILGGGSNVLIADEGFAGLVIKIGTKGISLISEKDEFTCIYAGAGEDWDLFCLFCVENDLQGVECLSGIPGLIGGTPIQNVGAYGQEVAETITAVRCFDTQTKQFVEMTNAECKFGYRTSIFNTTEKNRYVVVSVNFALKTNGDPAIQYQDLLNYFANKKPNLKDLRDAVLKIRAEKSMVIDKNDPNSQSAGSFFKNPIISRDNLRVLEKSANKLKIKKVPFYEVDVENVKIPAAWLIENSGFYKGYKLGKAGISTKHTLALINADNAAAKDVLQLKNQIQNKVKDTFNILLQPEPIFVGFKNKEIF